LVIGRFAYGFTIATKTFLRAKALRKYSGESMATFYLLLNIEYL